MDLGVVLHLLPLHLPFSPCRIPTMRIPIEKSVRKIESPRKSNDPIPPAAETSRRSRTDLDSRDKDSGGHQ